MPSVIDVTVMKASAVRTYRGLSKTPYIPLMGIQCNPPEVSVELPQNTEVRTTVWSSCITSGYTHKRISLPQR